jgi:hypothetical protein
MYKFQKQLDIIFRTENETMPEGLTFKGNLPYALEKAVKSAVVTEQGYLYLQVSKSEVFTKKEHSVLYILTDEEKQEYFGQYSNYGYFLGYCTIGSFGTEHFLNLNTEKFLKEKGWVIFNKMKADAASKTVLKQFLFGKKECFLWDAGNRYTTICWKEGNEWKRDTAHVWEQGSPRLQAKRDVNYNPNTGESNGTWKPFRPIETDFDNVQEWCQWVWDNQDSTHHSITDEEINTLLISRINKLREEEKPYLLELLDKR